MAEAKSNADLDLMKVSRDGANSTYQVVPTEPWEGNRVEQILGEPTPAKPSEDKAAEKAAEALSAPVESLGKPKTSSRKKA